MVKGIVLVGLMLTATSVFAECLDKSNILVSTTFQLSPACVETPVTLHKGELLYGVYGDEPISYSDVWDGGYSFVTTESKTYVEQITNKCTKTILNSRTYTVKQKTPTRFFVVTGYELSYGSKRFYDTEALINAGRTTEASSKAEMPRLRSWCEKARLEAIEIYKNIN